MGSQIIFERIISNFQSCSGLSFLEIAQAPASDTSAGSEAETMHRDTLPSRPHPSVRWRANTGHWPTQSRLISAAPKTSGIKWMQEFSRTRLSVLRGLCDSRDYQVTHRYNPQISHRFPVAATPSTPLPDRSLPSNTAGESLQIPSGVAAYFWLLPGSLKPEDPGARYGVQKMKSWAPNLTGA